MTGVEGCDGAMDAGADEDDWGSGGDDFGDFNDAAVGEGQDDDGFGAFSDAALQQPAASPAAASPSSDASKQQNMTSAEGKQSLQETHS